MDKSPLQVARYQYKPKLPGILREEIATIVSTKGEQPKLPPIKRQLKLFFQTRMVYRQLSLTKVRVKEL